MNRTGVDLSRNLQLTELTREKSLRCDVSRDDRLLAKSSNMARVKTKDPSTVQARQLIKKVNEGSCEERHLQDGTRIKVMECREKME